VLDGYINSNILTFTQRYGEQKKFCKIAALWFRIYPKRTDRQCELHCSYGCRYIWLLFPPFSRKSAHFCGHTWSNVQQLGKKKCGKDFIFILKLIMLFDCTDFRETLNFSIALFEVLYRISPKSVRRCGRYWISPFIQYDWVHRSLCNSAVPDSCLN